ncbi:pilus assembly protein [Fictibacillus sp. b24]|uniref:TadE/TadG family type IV pilus assembly protein n=1 Tax=Fictibacillus sp. b24 TaxID=3055863 RepID=UPI0025A21D08|nr:TadE family protein [Fictibacillus sp. b24]MDM5314862.1 pilus assembly protein [Fictibacillus sp. b24]
MKNEKGQSLVEFALVVPVLFFLLLGIVDFGRIFHAYLTLDHAGREAARSASIGNSNPVSVAVSKGSGINLSSSQVSFSKANGEAKITIVYPIGFLTPVISNVIGPITLTNTTVMRIE